MTAVRHLRTVSTADGGSRFAELDIELAPEVFAPPAAPFDVSEPIPAHRVRFYSAPPGWEGDWHPTPTRQLYVQLRGVLEVTTSDGDCRNITPGQVILLEDETGRGHLSRVIGGQASEGVFVQLPPAH